MTTRAKMFLAKLLIFFSVVLILFGVYLQFSGNYILDPEKDVTIVAGADDNISVTPVDKDNVSDTKEPESTDDGNKTGEIVSPSPTPSSSPSSSPMPTISPSPSITPTPQPSTPPAVTPPTPPVTPPIPSIDETNGAIRKELEAKYGIQIRYGNEVAGYSVGGMTTMIIPDANTANVALNNLKNALGHYPDDFFQEISRNGYPLTIYLIKRYSTANVTGVTDSTRKNIIISIATDYDFDDTLHHEVYHYVEKFIYGKGFRFTSWSTLNPADFTYGVFNVDYAYSRVYSPDAPFVNSYAQTDEYEDRASTFEYMMKPNKASCLNNGKPVWLKAKTMSEQIDFFLESVKPNVTEYWERFVY